MTHNEKLAGLRRSREMVCENYDGQIKAIQEAKAAMLEFLDSLEKSEMATIEAHLALIGEAA
jgi:archaellum biogenesis protein FlaJ (TadC family)